MSRGKDKPRLNRGLLDRKTSNRGGEIKAIAKEGPERTSSDPREWGQSKLNQNLST